MTTTTQSRIKTTTKMSNTGYHANAKPNWWVRVGDRFLRIPSVRGDHELDVVVDVPPGTEVHCGAGKGSHKTVRVTVVTTAIEEVL